MYEPAAKGNPRLSEELDTKPNIPHFQVVAVTPIPETNKHTRWVITVLVRKTILSLAVIAPLVTLVVVLTLVPD
jgi:hypothetical protein